MDGQFRQPSSEDGFCLASVVDRNYVVPYAAMLASFRAHNVLKASAFILHYDLKPDDQSFIKRIGNAYNIGIELIELPRYPFLLFQTRRRISLNSRSTMSPIAYAKAFLDRYLPQDKTQALCIDADIIVNGDMAGVFEVGFTAPVAAVSNIPRNHQHQFNSGFMLVNLAAWREISVSNVAERFLFDYSDSLHSHDQHVLNLIFRDRWKKLSLKWNYMEDHYRFLDKNYSYTHEEVLAARANPTIVHYAVGLDKPWKIKCQHPLVSLYKMYRLEALQLAHDLDIIDPEELEIS